MNVPRISVVITTRNRPAFLAESLGSVIGQDYRDYEILVVDDASDNPEENANVIARFSGPIRHVLRDRKGGPSAARNTGISASSGEFIAFLDDDDLWFPSKLGRQVATFDSNRKHLPRLGLVYCGHQWIDFQTGFVRPRRMPRMSGIDDLFTQQYNIIQTVLVKRTYVDEAGGFNEGMAFNENLEFLARVARRCDFDWVEDILVICRGHSGPRTADNSSVVLSGYEQTLQSARTLGVTPAVLHGDYYRLARLQIAAGSTRVARQSFLQAVKVAPAPLKVRYSALFCLSYVGRLLGRNVRSIRGTELAPPRGNQPEP